jgi:hypothetical protein
VFATAAALLAVTGHVLGGGGLPDPPALLVTAALLGLAVSGMARRRRSARGIFAVLLISQIPFHLILTVAGHDHGHVGLARMATFHAIAAALTALVLARGEDAIYGLLSFLGRSIPRRIALPAPTGILASVPVFPRIARGHADWAGLAAITRRGPPLTS